MLPQRTLPHVEAKLWFHIGLRSSYHILKMRSFRVFAELSFAGLFQEDFARRKCIDSIHGEHTEPACACSHSQNAWFCGNLHLPVFIKKTLPGGTTKMFLFRFMLESGLRNGRLRSFVDCLSFLRSFHSLFPARTLHSCVYGQHSLFPCTYPTLTISCAYPLVIPHPRNLHVMPLNGVRLEQPRGHERAPSTHYSQRVPSTHYFLRVPSTHCYPARAQHSLFPARTQHSCAHPAHYFPARTQHSLFPARNPDHYVCAWK